MTVLILVKNILIVGFVTMIPFSANVDLGIRKVFDTSSTFKYFVNFEIYLKFLSKLVKTSTPQIFTKMNLKN